MYSKAFEVKSIIDMISMHDKKCGFLKKRLLYVHVLKNFKSRIDIVGMYDMT